MKVVLLMRRTKCVADFDKVLRSEVIECLYFTNCSILFLPSAKHYILSHKDPMSTMQKLAGPIILPSLSCVYIIMVVWCGLEKGFT